MDSALPLPTNTSIYPRCRFTRASAQNSCYTHLCVNTTHSCSRRAVCRCSAARCLSSTRSVSLPSAYACPSGRTRLCSPRPGAQLRDARSRGHPAPRRHHAALLHGPRRRTACRPLRHQQRHPLRRPPGHLLRHPPRRPPRPRFSTTTGIARRNWCFGKSSARARARFCKNSTICRRPRRPMHRLLPHSRPHPHRQHHTTR